MRNYGEEHTVQLQGKPVRFLLRRGSTRRINIRISEKDLTDLKIKAREEGLPYQTLVSSVLHKYLNGRLVERS